MRGKTASPDLNQVRAEIERDRAALSDTVGRLTARSDVRARAKVAARRAERHR